MEAVDQPKPFVLPPQIKPKGRKKQAPASTDAPIEETESTMEASPPDLEAPAADPPADSNVPDHSRVPPVPKASLSPEELIAYHRSIPELERNAWFIGYIYRGLPICDNLQPLSDADIKLIQQKKKKKPVTNIGKLIEPLDPQNWQQQILDKYGAGDYAIRLNDQHPSVRGTVCYCAINPETGGDRFRDWDNYPPLLNPEEVVLSEEKNQGYVRWARLHGIKFPGDPQFEETIEPTEEETTDMAALEAVMKQNKDLTDKVLQMASDRPAQPAPQAASAAARAEAGSVETVVEASKQGTRIMGDIMKTVLESNIRNNDPAERMRETIEMAKLLTPPPAPANNGASEMMALMKMQMEASDKKWEAIMQMQKDSHKESMEMMKSRLDALEREKSAAPTVSGGSPEAVLDGLIRMKEKLDTLTDSGAPQSSGPAWLEPTLNFAEKAMGNIANGLQGIAALRAAEAQSPRPAAPAAGELPPAKVITTQESKETMERRNHAIMIGPHLIAAMKSGSSGNDFAAALIHQTNQGAYDSLAQNGYQGVVDFLRLHEPLYQELMQPPIGGQALDKFIMEFLDRGKVNESLALLRGEKPAAQKHGGPVVTN
jgi:hypothetical protein